jgi:ABC-type multidrug transport system fused ATPase/permease subunit
MARQKLRNSLPLRSGGGVNRYAHASQDPRIPILDEAASAIDAQSEEAMQSALETLMKGRPHGYTVWPAARRRFASSASCPLTAA